MFCGSTTVTCNYDKVAEAGFLLTLEVVAAEGVKFSPAYGNSMTFNFKTDKVTIDWNWLLGDWIETDYDFSGAIEYQSAAKIVKGENENEIIIKNFYEVCDLVGTVDPEAGTITFQPQYMFEYSDDDYDYGEFYFVAIDDEANPILDAPVRATFGKSSISIGQWGAYGVDCDLYYDYHRTTFTRDNDNPGGGNTDKPEDGGNTDKPEDGGNTDKPEDGGNTDNPGEGGNTDNPEEGGNTGNPEEGGNTDNPEEGETKTKTVTFLFKNYPKEGTTVKEGDVTFTGGYGTSSTSTRFWHDGLRTYSGSTMWFEVPDGMVITKIDFSNGLSEWTGSQSMVRYTGLTKMTITSATVTYQYTSGTSTTDNTFDWNWLLGSWTQSNYSSNGDIHYKNTITITKGDNANEVVVKNFYGSYNLVGTVDFEARTITFEPQFALHYDDDYGDFYFYGFVYEDDEYTPTDNPIVANMSTAGIAFSSNWFFYGVDCGYVLDPTGNENYFHYNTKFTR